MPDPKAQIATQLRNIEESTGQTVADFAEIVSKAGLEKHGQIVSFLKSHQGLTYGNANLITHMVREAQAGGPVPPRDLLAAQYAVAKNGLLPIHTRLVSIAEEFGDDVETVVQKTE